MKLYVHLAIVLCALHAHAATINAPPHPELEKKLPEDPNKDVVPSENVSSEQELIDSANTINDVENNLRVKAIDSIPVKVIVEEPAEDIDVKRVEIDLKNPGIPQRQEHETQNPMVFNEGLQVVTTVKQTVLDTEAALKQGFQNVADGIQNWISNNQQITAIQANIQGLQQSFTEQINKLNATIQSYLNNNRDPSIALPEVNKEPPKEIKNVESHLKTLENNFQTGVKALTEGVEIFATLRGDNEKPTTQEPSPPNNLFLQYLQLFQTTLTQGFNNVTQAIQNYVGQGNNSSSSTQGPGGIFQGINNGFQNILNQGGQQSSNPPAGAQSDEPASVRPTIWQGIQNSLQNILNPNQQTQASPVTQGSQVPSQSRPIAQAIQNLPFVQGVVNLIQPNKPAAEPEKPAQPEQPAKPAQEGSNSVPEPSQTESKPADEPVKASEEPPKVTEQQQPAKPEAVPNGPIMNIIQNNPIVKGISGAVHRLQASINPNAERPRDPVQDVNQKGDTKGHYQGSRPGNYAGDNNSGVGVAVKSETPEEVKIEEPVPEPQKELGESKPETEKTEQS